MQELGKGGVQLHALIHRQSLHDQLCLGSSMIPVYFRDLPFTWVIFSVWNVVPSRSLSRLVSLNPSKSLI